MASLPFSQAAINNKYGNIPKMDQWTNTQFPIGTVNNATRINGIWYIDGRSYPAQQGVTSSNGPTNTVPASPNITPTPNTNLRTTPQPDANPTSNPTPETIPEMPVAVYTLVAVLAVIIISTAGVAAKQTQKKSKQQ